MEIKWFFVTFGIVFTVAILAGVYFMGAYQSTQDRTHFEAIQTNADERFENSSYERDVHYNQTSEDFEKIEQILEIKLVDHATLEQVLKIKLEDHETLSILNQSVGQIAEVLNNTSGLGTNGSIITIPVPIVVNNSNGNVTAGNNINNCDPTTIGNTTYHPYCKL